MRSYPEARKIIEYNRRFLPGGVASINRLTQPEVTFVKAIGAHLWDADGNEYIDYHAAFAPYLLGHNDPFVNQAVIRSIDEGHSLYGSGTSTLEGQLADLICRCVPFIESVAILNTGSEATYQAMRLARAATKRDHFIVVQGGYNGWHNDVCCNLMTPLAQLGPRRSPGEYPFYALSAGIPIAHQSLIHPVNFNDLDSVRYVAERYPVAGLITEPILQNIGVVAPAPGYLEGLRQIADQAGFVLIFDEVKTGFRHALGGYATLSGVAPDLVTYGKAVANGYPVGIIGGRKSLLDLFVHPDPQERVLLAGTYNGHPVVAAAAIATIQRLMNNNGEIYTQLEQRGSLLERELEGLVRREGIPAVVCRQGSALCLYFMDHAPRDWHDIAQSHDFALDERFRRALIANGVYVFPLATKQWSISAAHSEADMERTVHALRKAMPAALANRN